MSRTKKLIVWILLAIPVFVLVGNLALAGKPSTPVLPNVRYRIKYVQMPDNAMSYLNPIGMTNALLIGNTRQVRVVGSYDDIYGRTTAFLYDPQRDPQRGCDLSCWFVDDAGVPLDSTAVPETYPTGYRLVTAWDISDRGVIVGTLKNETGNRRSFAIDLAMSPPVLDLLPTFGSTNSRASRINENGDILITCQDSFGTFTSYVFNPCYYGEHRAARENGEPIDFNDPIFAHLASSLPLSGDPNNLFLNDPLEVSPGTIRPPQVAGTTANGVNFRYTLGATAPEILGAPLTIVSALNDDGAFSGTAMVRSKIIPLRGYDGSSGIVFEQVPTTYSDKYPHDMNHSRDLLTRTTIFRDDWGWVALGNLVIGTSTDVALWKSDTRGFLLWPYLSDRIGIANSGGSVTTTAGIIAGGRNNILVILTPEVWPQ